MAQRITYDLLYQTHIGDRINELAAIAKVRELTEEELAERTVLRRAYIDAIKGSLRAHLESIEIVEE